MKVSASTWLKIQINEKTGEYISPSASYLEIDLDGDVDAQLLKARETATKALKSTLSLTSEQVTYAAGRNLSVNLIQVFEEIDKKLSELEAEVRKQKNGN